MPLDNAPLIPGDGGHLMGKTRSRVCYALVLSLITAPCLLYCFLYTGASKGMKQLDQGQQSHGRINGKEAMPVRTVEPWNHTAHALQLESAPVAFFTVNEDTTRNTLSGINFFIDALQDGECLLRQFGWLEKDIPYLDTIGAAADLLAKILNLQHKGKAVADGDSTKRFQYQLGTIRNSTKRLQYQVVAIRNSTKQLKHSMRALGQETSTGFSDMTVDFATMFQLLHRSQNEFLSVLKEAVYELKLDILASELTRIMSGIQLWIDAQHDLHDSGSDKDVGMRRVQFLEAVDGMVPDLKKSLFELRDRITGDNVGLIGQPLLIELASVLHHQGVCPQRMLHYANALHGMMFQAGLAYCESVHLSSQPSSGTSCDMSWSWGSLEAVRQAVREQARNDFGISWNQSGRCFKREVAAFTELARQHHGNASSRVGFGWVQNGHGVACTDPSGTSVTHSVDYDGSLESCLAACEKTFGCTAVDYHPQHRDCWLFESACVATRARPGGLSYKLQVKGRMPWLLTKHLCDRTRGPLSKVNDDLQAEIRDLWSYIMKEADGNASFGGYYVAVYPLGGAVPGRPATFQYHQEAIDFPGHLVGFVPQACGVDGFYAFMSPQAPLPPFHVQNTHLNGPCSFQQDSACLTSPNYPGDYEDKQGCIFAIEGYDGVLNTHDFNTERDYDMMVVDGRRYSGSDGPQGQPLLPGGSTISWYSDYSNTASGWKVCYEPVSPSTFADAATDVVSKLPGFCEEPLRNGHREDAIACLKTSLQLFCSQVKASVHYFPEEWSPCSYQIIFVHTNSSDMYDQHQRTSDVEGMFVKKGESWTVVIG